jgi:hypothetical protein
MCVFRFRFCAHAQSKRLECVDIRTEPGRMRTFAVLELQSRVELYIERRLSNRVIVCISMLSLTLPVLDFLLPIAFSRLEEWYDYKLTWKPSEYGGVDRLYVPSTKIWLPDIVLYNK